MKKSLTCNWSVVVFGYSVSSTSKTDRHDITEILLKVTLNTTTLTQPWNLPKKYTWFITWLGCVHGYHLEAFHILIISSQSDYEKFEDTKGLIRSHQSKKDRQYNGLQKRTEGTTNDLQNTTQKT